MRDALRVTVRVDISPEAMANADQRRGLKAELEAALAGVVRVLAVSCGLVPGTVEMTNDEETMQP